MLKRRLSKRFVLAESGEEVTWDATVDNDSTKVESPTVVEPKKSDYIFLKNKKLDDLSGIK